MESMENQKTRGILDDETFQKAVGDFKERIFLLLLRYVRNRDDALDLTQETFIRAYRSRESFRGDSGIYTWLYKIAVNLALNHKSRSHTSSLQSIEDSPDLYDSASPADSVTNAEINKQVDQAVSKLPARQRMVFVLRYYEEKSNAEIAKALGITEGAVKANYHQAIKKLQTGLASLLTGDVL